MRRAWFFVLLVSCGGKTESSPPVASDAADAAPAVDAGPPFAADAGAVPMVCNSVSFFGGAVPLTPVDAPPMATGGPLPQSTIYILDSAEYEGKDNAGRFRQENIEIDGNSFASLVATDSAEVRTNATMTVTGPTTFTLTTTCIDPPAETGTVTNVSYSNDDGLTLIEDGLVLHYHAFVNKR